MRRPISRTRWWQIVVLSLLVLSAVQVFWWIMDQSRRTRELRERLTVLYQADARAATELARRGTPEETIESLFPHLAVDADGGATVRPEELEALRRDRLRWLNQYGWEGAFFLVVLAISMGAVWRALHQESQLRRRHENFVASVSHELKSPLASLRLSVETLALRELPRERVRELAERMAADLGRMEDMVGRILDTSRIDDGRVRLHPEAVALAAAVARVVDELGSRLEGAGVEVEVEIDPGLEVWADPVSVVTVVRNLLDNALAAVAAAGTGGIRVRAAAVGGQVRLRVEDDGVGFPPEEAERLFEKFYRPGDELRRRGGGQGLGLFIVRRFVELDRGSVSAESDGVGRGAAFEVRWPAADEEAA